MCEHPLLGASGTARVTAVAVRATNFFAGALSTDPHRVGKPLNAPLDGVHSAG